VENQWAKPVFSHVCVRLVLSFLPPLPPLFSTGKGSRTVRVLLLVPNLSQIKERTSVLQTSPSSPSPSPSPSLQLLLPLHSIDQVSLPPLPKGLRKPAEFQLPPHSEYQQYPEMRVGQFVPQLMPLSPPLFNRLSRRRDLAQQPPAVTL
jgi:hypothetical protein